MACATSVDAIVGHNIRIQRIARKLSQHVIAERIGVSFQQMQKYEKGTNRVSAGRLWHLADAFGVPIDTFYASLETHSRREPSPLRLISRRDAYDLVQAFSKIKSGALRRSIVSLVMRLAVRK
jgi:transcriptional regulator with XRE-family HTH domain